MEKLNKKLKATNTIMCLIILISIFLGIFIGTQVSSKKEIQDIKQEVNINTVDKKDKININTASLEQLKTLPNIGEVKARKIIEKRPYKRKTDLIDIVGQKTYENIKESVVCE